MPISQFDWKEQNNSSEKSTRMIIQEIKIISKDQLEKTAMIALDKYNLAEKPRIIFNRNLNCRFGTFKRPNIIEIATGMYLVVYQNNSREFFETRLRDTVKHEYAHYIAYQKLNPKTSHGIIWKTVARSIGADDSATHHDHDHTEYKKQVKRKISMFTPIKWIHNGKEFTGIIERYNKTRATVRESTTSSKWYIDYITIYNHNIKE